MLNTTLIFSFCKDGGGSVNVNLWSLGLCVRCEVICRLVVAGNVFLLITIINIDRNRLPAIRAKAALKFGNEAWVLKKREKQRLEAAQTKFLRHLLGITKLDKEKNQCIRQKSGARNIAKEIKQYQKKWL